MKYAALFLLAGSLTASPLLLTNAQSSNDNTAITNGRFGGWDFGQPQLCICDDLQDGAIQIYLPIIGDSSLSSGDAFQSLSARASVDFSAPGYQMTIVDIHGYAQDDGILAGENVFLTSPCAAALAGDSNQFGDRCGAGFISSGTISVGFGIWAEPRGQFGNHSQGVVSNVSLLMTLIPVGVPEPGYGALVALACLSVIWRPLSARPAR